MGENKFLDILRKSKMNMKEFGEYFNIPYRTVQNWKNGTATCPSYVLDLMEYKLDKEKEEKVMKKFELRKNSGEFKRDEVMEGCTLNQRDQEPEIIASFDNKEDALKALVGYSTSVNEFSTAGGTRYSVTEYYIEENEYDEDGDWVEGGDVWNYSEMPEEF